LIPAGAWVKVDVVQFEILHAEWALLWLVVGIGVQDGHGDDGDGGGEGELKLKQSCVSKNLYNRGKNLTENVFFRPKSKNFDKNCSTEFSLLLLLLAAAANMTTKEIECDQNRSNS